MQCRMKSSSVRHSSTHLTVACHSWIQYLCEAYDEFQDAKADLDGHKMKVAYKKYRKYWKACVNAALALEIELKKRE